ncbi:MAG: ribonuclease P protein component [Roseiarcus sp.]
MMEPDALGEDARRDAAHPPLMGRLRRRAEFQRVSRGRRAHVESFTLQANARALADAPPGEAPRVGFTVTKRIGDAVERNRIRRRLKEALRRADAVAPAPGHDYVLMARREALTRPFAALVADIEKAFAKMSRLEPPVRAAPRRAPPATDREKRS